MKSRTLKEKLGPSVIEFVERAVEGLAESGPERFQLFSPKRYRGYLRVSKVWRSELIDAMIRNNRETTAYPRESLRRSLGVLVYFPKVARVERPTLRRLKGISVASRISLATSIERLP